MQLPYNFKFGRFKLESYFVNYYNDILHDIIINGIEMTIWEEKCNIDEKLSKGERLRVRLGDEGPIYLIKIENKKWVYIEKV